MNLATISDATALGVLGQAAPVLLIFTDPRCGPCRAALEAGTALARRMPGLKVLEAPLADCQLLALQSRVRAVPQWVLWQSGAAAASLVGLRQPKVLADWLQAQLGGVDEAAP